MCAARTCMYTQENTHTNMHLFYFVTITTATQPPPSPHTHMQRHTCRQCQAYMRVQTYTQKHAHMQTSPPTHPSTQASMYTHVHTQVLTHLYTHLPWPPTHITQVLTTTKHTQYAGTVMHTQSLVAQLYAGAVVRPPWRWKRFIGHTDSRTASPLLTGYSLPLQEVSSNVCL